MLFLSLLALSLPLAVTAATPNPCARISKAVSEGNSAPVAVSAQIAKDCLESMPFYPELAVSFIDELTKYIQWQSTLEALKSPPETYTSSPTDILGGLEKIRSNNFSSQWDFDLAINALLSTANDGHLSVNLCSTTLFAFVRNNIPLVSISKDGLDKPEIYTRNDAFLLNNTRVKVSPIASIDGQDPVKYLQKIPATIGFQDPDARYNNVFYSFPEASTPLQYGSFFRNAVFSDRNITALEFRNGSTFESQTAAIVLNDDFQAQSGEDVFDSYCRQPRKSNTSPSELTHSGDSSDARGAINPPPEAGPSYLPRPFIRDPYNQMVGYYLDNDTVVMVVTSFYNAGQPETEAKTFADTATEIVTRALESGRSKIIIDVSTNGGGQISRALDLFKLFFPTEFPYTAARFRRHQVSEDLVKVYSVLDESAKLNPNLLRLAWAFQVTPDQEGGFDSYQDFLGNKTELGVKVSSLLGEFNFTAISGDGDRSPIRGYAGWPVFKKQPFQPEDILIIGDGRCSSSCTTFTNMMTNIGGVRTLAFGGQPNNKPMQPMGGVRGIQVLPFSDIYSLVQEAENLLNHPQVFDFISRDEVKRFLDVVPRPLDKFPLVLRSGQVNFFNSYQEGDDDLPLQFQYQAADCRLYYTADNVFRPETTWKSAKAAIWGNGSCIEGSMGGKGSLKDKSDKGKKGNNTDDEGKSGKKGSDGTGGEDSGASKAMLGWTVVTAAIAAVLM
ncbi:peptidase S41 [Fusarium pseudoanthophilum]|uniref:Peptidase S41 n=1 Tax=Fusarium pseudoanthophilum TaxID=48495 RepID=A0A8H5PCE7_9HYPO|nr:peptidase S41 [Fusarium pseudoanthophilum]